MHFVIMLTAYFLKEVCNVLSLGAVKSHEGKEIKSCIPWTLVYYMTLTYEYNIIKQIISFRSRLKKRNHCGTVKCTSLMPKILDYLVCG